jgi:manganese/zinc/iron transport system permease protein
LIRVLRFRQKCFEENVLKGMWKKGRVSFSSLKESHYLTSMILCFLLWKMEREGWIVREEKLFALTLDGKKRAARIVRLHRLWEAYLADLGWPGERVHRTAEEMEHILTPELEERLSFLLSDPKLDPHSQPIPERGL